MLGNPAADMVVHQRSQGFKTFTPLCRLGSDPVPPASWAWNGCAAPRERVTGYWCSTSRYR